MNKFKVKYLEDQGDLFKSSISDSILKRLKNYTAKSFYKWFNKSKFNESIKVDILKSYVNSRVGSFKTDRIRNLLYQFNKDSFHSKFIISKLLILAKENYHENFNKLAQELFEKNLKNEL